MSDCRVEAPETLVRIGVLAQLSGVSVRYLRRLSDNGLLPTCRPGPGYHRLYPREDSLRRLRRLLNLQLSI